MEGEDDKQEDGRPGLFNREAVKNLKIAVAIANELRLRTYLANKGQKDDMMTKLPYEVRNRREAATKRAFYMEDLEPIFQFYYRVLPLYEGTRAFYLNKGIISKRLLMYIKAKECFEEAITRAKREIWKAYIVSLLGYVLRKLGKNKKGLESYNKAQNINIEFFGEDHIQVAILCVNIGAIYRIYGWYKEAIKCCKKALKIVIAKFCENNIEVATIWQTLGTVYQAQGRYEKALENYAKLREDWKTQLDI